MSTMSTTYESVAANDDDDEHDEHGENAAAIEVTGISTATTSSESFDDEYEHDDQLQCPPPAVSEEQSTKRNYLNRWEDEPILPSSLITCLLVLLLLQWIAFFHHFTGRLWATWAFVLHLHLRIGVSRRYFDVTAEDFADPQRQKRSRIARSLSAFLDVALCGAVYPLVVHFLTIAFFRDVDGEINFDWKSQVLRLRIMAGTGVIVAVLRIGVGAFPCFGRIRKRRVSSSDRDRHPVFRVLCKSDSISDIARQRISKVFRFSNWIALALNGLCVLSVLSHFGPWPTAPAMPAKCDPLDPTLCALPFPSFHHMKEDETTSTGWRVDLKGLPPLRGGIPFHPTFLNDLDGFSTMAPILFYVEGMKEAHEGGMNGGGASPNRLQGPESIEKSVTNESVTLLVDVDGRSLVPHSAEIDYLDPDRPLVMIIPARPLRHGTHFAVAVVDAHDVDGNRLPRSEGMESLFESIELPRYERFRDVVLPALRIAPWVDLPNDPESIQLVFDFVTVSEGSQIGATRAVRDIALKHVDGWNWEDHVELVSEIKHDCSHDDSLVARTYNINLDVPFFLKRRSRYSILDRMALTSGEPTSIEKAKAMIRVPCSVEQAALGDENGKAVKAIMEYGHGLFYHRGEVRDGFLSRMANENGYILMAMDWRGMSIFDMPVVIKTLLGNPNSFQSVRDNLIQGYSEKLCLQHFSRNGMLDWLKIDGINIPTENDERPTSVFYGISQGGILGGGYMALAGGTTLVDRAVLGSPGTPFASVLTRSHDFIGYDTLMLFNFYNNRHVRLLLSLLQMGWDSVESCGLLAPPVHEPLPPILIQTGLGDAVVPTGACEAMARAMDATALPGAPRAVYGVPAAEPVPDGGAVLAELLYEEELGSLPADDTIPEGNSVHFCVRWDRAMIRQIEAFVNTGQISNPCAEDGCIRASANNCMT